MRGYTIATHSSMPHLRGKRQKAMPLGTAYT